MLGEGDGGVFSEPSILAIVLHARLFAHGHRKFHSLLFLVS